MAKSGESWLTIVSRQLDKRGAVESLDFDVFIDNGVTDSDSGDDVLQDDFSKWMALSRGGMKIQSAIGAASAIVNLLTN
jgi:hypothetical protein